MYIIIYIYIYIYIHTCFRSLTGHIENAVCAAQKLWREQHLQELDKLKSKQLFECIKFAHYLQKADFCTGKYETDLEAQKLSISRETEHANDAIKRTKLVSTVCVQRKLCTMIISFHSLLL